MNSQTPLREHEHFMHRAIELARQAWGDTHPNPLVGAVIVEDGHVVAGGWHAKDGGPHAERVAITALNRRPKEDATIYVTLEPCSTHGRTGACCELIKEAGIRRVVVGTSDPNPVHAGRGLDVLRAAGVEVLSGVCERECRDLNLIFNHWISTGRPLFAGKIATTLDGKTAARTGASRWITGEKARADVHHWRRYFPGIAVGAMTVLQDNPRLTARTPEGEWCPWRFVFDGLLRTVLDRRLPDVYTDEYHERTIVVTTPHGGHGYVRKLKEMGVKVWVIDSDTQRVPFAAFRRKCAEERIAGVYFEGGSMLMSELLRSRELDYLFAYRAPILFADEKAKGMLGGLRPSTVEQALRLTDIRSDQFGDDALVRGRLVYPEEFFVDEALFGLR